VPERAWGFKSPLGHRTATTETQVSDPRTLGRLAAAVQVKASHDEFELYYDI
jgi:hypothetical protein